MNNGGIAYYDTVNSNSNTLIFNYTVQAGQNTTALAVLGFRQTSGVHYFSPIIKDTFGNYVNGSMFPITFDGLVIIAPTNGLLDALTINQQLELIYIAYFNRAADGGGNTFWGGQNTQAQANGQSAAVALTNIANSFTPQPETEALYPFLGTPNPSSAQIGVLIDSMYGNMFGHVADAVGKAYWSGQIISGAVGLGAAALAIANGATGADMVKLLNKITVATDFTTRTSAAGLGESAPLSNSYLTAARNISGVDSLSLNDGSVTAGMTATTTFITGSATSHTNSLASSDQIVITSDSIIDPGVGNHMIHFMPSASADTLVLHAGGVDQVSGFNKTDALDLRALFNEANVNVSTLSNYLTIVAQGSDTMVSFDPAGHGGGSTVAVMQGLGMINLSYIIA
jgi:hypothetical protein